MKQTIDRPSGHAPPMTVILDSTLRDGEQAAGVVLTPAEKAEYVRQAEAIGIRYIEVGFPHNPLDLEACRAAAAAARSARIVAMALTTRESVQRVSDIGAHEVLLVVPCSDSHLRNVYSGGFEELEARLRESIELADSLGLGVNVGLEDASHRDGDVLSRILRVLRAQSRPICCVTIADTRGLLIPWEAAALVDDVAHQLDGLPCSLAFHAHNDLGLAVANSLATLSLQPAIDCVHATMCGFGERAGNASLEQVVVLLETRLARRTGVQLAGLASLAAYVERIFLTPLHPHAPILGSKAFLHESGLHQKAMLRDDSSYQCLDPARFEGQAQLILGKHSGKALRRRLAAAAGCSEEDVWRLQCRIATENKEPRRAAVARALEELRRHSFMGRSHRDAIAELAPPAETVRAPMQEA
jgi:isopropylmalate/homocitrate/citramalate synthase